MFASIRWWFTAPSVRSTLALRNHRLPLSGLRLRNVVLKLAFVVKASVIYMYVRHGMLQSLAIPTSPIYDVDTEVKLPKRLKRFRDFSSIEYNGVAYMTPQDFLDSLTMDSPKARVFRRVINNNQLKKMLKATPPLRKGSNRFFRNLGENGVISYAEYLFLITLLTKSQYAFNIAFLMFDEDENLQISRNEFLLSANCSIIDEVELSVLNKLKKLRATFSDGFTGRTRSLLEQLISNSLKRFKSLRDSRSEDNAGHDQVVLTNPSTTADVAREKEPFDTTVLVHLFGNNGRNSLSLDQFQVFYNNLQRELIEIEFHEFARGKTEISSVDFTRLVLRYSLLHQRDHLVYVKRIYERSQPEDEGITLAQFEQFSMFLNNLEEFAKAVRLYTAADIPVSRNEFIRAVKCSTGFQLDEHLVDVLYKIFDTNGDDKLSYSEFIEIMTDRLHRGFRTYSSRHSAFGWIPFKNCMIHELSKPPPPAPSAPSTSNSTSNASNIAAAATT